MQLLISMNLNLNLPGIRMENEEIYIRQFDYIEYVYQAYLESTISDNQHYN